MRAHAGCSGPDFLHPHTVSLCGAGVAGAVGEGCALSPGAHRPVLQAQLVLQPQPKWLGARCATWEAGCEGTSRKSHEFKQEAENAC
eukprot:1142831-Pelagomonas_calceolata.AAC.6